MKHSFQQKMDIVQKIPFLLKTSHCYWIYRLDNYNLYFNISLGWWFEETKDDSSLVAKIIDFDQVFKKVDKDLQIKMIFNLYLLTLIEE